ncbi:MAG: Polyribonucleotide nucleotidyltransferase, partial [Parcubacteria group bacterium GW2011_GWB1_50_9]
IAGVRVGRANGEFILNPTYAEREACDLEVALSGTRERINMMEAGATEVSEEVFASAVEWGFEFMKDLIDFQNKVIKENGKPKRSIKLSEPAPELYDLVKSEFSTRIEDASYQPDKKVMQEMKKRMVHACDGSVSRRFYSAHRRNGIRRRNRRHNPPADH